MRATRQAVLALMATTAAACGGVIPTASQAAAGATGNPITACAAETKTVETASDAFFNETGVYANGTAAGNVGGSTVTAAGQPVDIAALMPAYLSAQPPTQDRFTFSDTQGSVEGFHAGGKDPCAPREHESFAACALDAATVHTASGPVIENATIVVVNGKIRSVGTDAPPAGAQIVDCAGKHVWPGFVAPWTALGLVEVGSVRGTDDAAETGTINPNVRSDVEINPDSCSAYGRLASTAC